MIKLLRQGALEKPWVLRILMFSIAGAFVISMGWFGFQQSDQLYVAKIDETEVSRVEYRRAYQNAYRFYRNLLQDEFKEEDLGKIVINGIINRRLWLMAAKELHATASMDDVAEALIKDRSFYRRGRFDPDQYRFVLANSRPPQSPEQYENGLREDLSVDKVRNLIVDGIVLTDLEMEETIARVTDPELSPEEREEAEKRAFSSALRLKKQRAMAGYLESMRAKTPIDINEVLL